MDILKKVLYTSVGVVAVASERVTASLRSMRTNDGDELEEKYRSFSKIAQELKTTKDELAEFLSQKIGAALGYAPNQSKVEKLRAKIEELETRLERIKMEELEKEEVIKK